MKLKRVLITIATMGIVLLSACTPHQIEVFKTLNPEQQQAVLNHYSRQAASRDCYEAIDKHWHGDKSWARKIVHRESRNNPRAANTRSSARGCFQLLSMHDWRYHRVGCAPSQKLQPDCNTKAAWHLRVEAGRSPWRI